MTLGDILRTFRSETDTAQCLAAIGDPMLIRRIEIAGSEFDEAPGTYIANAAARFASMAEDDAWLALMTALERADDPTRAALVAIAEWAIKADSAPAAPCGCAGREGSAHAETTS